MNISFYDFAIGTKRAADIYENNYEHSKIRAYLNGLSYKKRSYETIDTYNNHGFLQTAFTSAAQNKIKTTAVDNSAKTTTDTSGAIPKPDGKDSKFPGNFICSNTQDKVFLLSVYEASKYSTEAITAADNERVRTNTDFCVATAGYPETTGQNGCWFLRSPCTSSDGIGCAVRTIDRDGIISAIFVDRIQFGIVPAIAVSF